MESDDGFKKLMSFKIKDGGSVGVTFPVPDFLEPIVLSSDNKRQGIDYYLLARYAYFHRMNKAFVINSFWSVEHLIFSLLVFEITDKKQLNEIGGYHSIVKFWNKAKTMVDKEIADCMSKFDNYIAKVKGYFSERYPQIYQKGKLEFTGKQPKVSIGEDSNSRSPKFGKVISMDINELDHFVNFVLHDVVPSSDNDPANFMQILASQKNIDLYKKENQFSIIFPNKIYHGELKQKLKKD